MRTPNSFCALIASPSRLGYTIAVKISGRGRTTEAVQSRGAGEAGVFCRLLVGRYASSRQHRDGRAEDVEVHLEVGAKAHPDDV